MNRRQFLELGSAGTAGAAFGLGSPQIAAAQTVALSAAQAGGARNASPAAANDDRLVRLSGDGLGLTPAQYARLLARLADEQGIQADDYILGGVVEELEARCARALGKEAAVFMPTGTLANHLAIRALASSGSAGSASGGALGSGAARAIVQATSHVYCDTGDGCQTLSNINLIPLAPGRASFTVADVQQTLDVTRSGRVKTPVAVISIESPVRRAAGAIFDPQELAGVIALARREGIRLHLDGARLFLEAAYAGKDVTEYTRPFDTVYVSLYKYFNAASGAILAGPRALLADMFHTRRMFGGGLSHAWPSAAVALHYLDGFGDRFRHGIRVSEEWMTAMGRHEGFTVQRVPSGTNLFRLRVAPAAAAGLRQRLVPRGILLSAPAADGTFLVGVNETLARTSAAELADAFVTALRG